MNKFHLIKLKMTFEYQKKRWITWKPQEKSQFNRERKKKRFAVAAKIHIMWEQTGNTRRGGTFQNALEVLHVSIASRFIADSLSVLFFLFPFPQLEAHSDDSVHVLTHVLQEEHSCLKSGLVSHWFLGSSSAGWSGLAASDLPCWVTLPARGFCLPLPYSTVNS